jgi:quercetin dioxygenase-like cupin family protein
MVLIENVDGAPRHTHPGLEMTYVLEGEFDLKVDGRPDQPLKPGDWFEVPQAADHLALNCGPCPHISGSTPPLKSGSILHQKRAIISVV